MGLFTQALQLQISVELRFGVPGAITQFTGPLLDQAARSEKLCFVRPLQAYGSMRAIFGVSASEIRAEPPRWRFVLVAFEVRMWRIFDWPRLNLPDAVFVKRLAAPEWVLSFGMVSCWNNLGLLLQPVYLEIPPHCAENAAIATNLRPDDQASSSLPSGVFVRRVVFTPSPVLKS